MALTTPFAQNGDKKAIPQNTSDGSVSFDRGFGSFYALPPEEGGLFIDRAQFNQLMFDTTSQVLENKQQITAQANRINEVNTTLTQSINTKANSNAVVALTGNQTVAGVKTFSSPIVLPKAVADNQAVILGQTLKILEESTEWTVGAGGKFTNLDSAIKEANKYYSRDFLKTITLKIISNITINNRVSIFRGGCRVIVTCENENIVTVNKNSTNPYDYTFSGFNFEFRNVSIKVEGSSTDNNNGSLFCFGNFKLINLKVTGKPCILIHNNGAVEVNDEMYQTNAVINRLNVEFSSKMRQGLVYIGNNSSLAIIGSKDTNIISNANIGFVSRVCSNIYFSGGITCNNIGTLFQVEWGGFISINAPSDNIVLNGATKANQAANTLTANGIIFGNYVL